MPNFIPSGLTEEQIAKAGLDTSPTKPQDEEYEGPVYSTTFVNKRSDPVRVFSERGMDLLQVPAKGESVLYSWDPGTMYAPFSKVVYDKKDLVSVSLRHGFDDPLDKVPYVLVLDNRDGASNESIKVGEQYYEVIKGIPRRVSVDIDDQLVIFKAIRYVKRTLEEPIPGNKDYLRKRVVIEKVMVPRKKSEIAKIKKLLSDEAAERARRQAERRFKGVVGMDEETADGAEMFGPDVEG